MIELLMVILLVAVLGVVALPQFLSFQKEGREAAARQQAATIRSAIVNMKTQMVLKCGATGANWPSIASLNSNDVVTGGDCTTAQVPNTANRKLIDHSVQDLPSLLGESPANPQMVPFTCLPSLRLTNGNPAAYGSGTSIWCYNVTTGEFWGESLTYPTLSTF